MFERPLAAVCCEAKVLSAARAESHDVQFPVRGRQLQAVVRYGRQGHTFISCRWQFLDAADRSIEAAGQFAKLGPDDLRIAYYSEARQKPGSGN